MAAHLDKNIEKLMQVNSLFWANTKKLLLRDGIRFSLSGMPYLADLVTCNKRIMNCKKGAQVCMTTTMYLDAVHACKYRRYNQNIMYMMPTVNAVERLSKVSFDPIYQFNPWLMTKGSTNTTMCKEINGRSIVMVGAQPKSVGGSNTKDSDNLRSVPCDVVMRDEIDLHDMQMVYLSKQRLKRSIFKKEVNFGSPTYPGYGIDEMYESSDQRKWQIKCNSCGKYTSLVGSFPDSIIQVGGKWIRACVHCHKEIFVSDGKWISDYPDRREAGFWLDGLISPYADLDDYMYEYNNTEGANRSEFMRSTLGVASTESEHQLSDTVVLNRCCSDGMQMVSTGETCMGVDVGKKLHVVIGIKTDRDSYEILNVSRHDNLGSVHDLALKMNVRVAVLDSGPYDLGVRDFQKAEPYSVYLCQYSEQMPGKPVWNDEGMVKVNRNEWCDKVHNVYSADKIVIPRSCNEVKEYAREMTKTAKSILTNAETGLTKPRWIKLGAGDDHYYHSTLYFLLAAQRSIVRKKHQGRVERPKKIQDNYVMT